MKKNQFIGIFLAIFIIVGIYSCKKPVDDFPDSNEVISFSNIDTTTIFKQAGEMLEVNVVIVTDTIIDSLKIGYFIDTIGITKNITFKDVNEVSLETGFPEINNKHQYLANIKLPVNAYGIRAFRPYSNGKGDYVRIIFRVQAGSRVYEKQLKVIIQP